MSSTKGAAAIAGQRRFVTSAADFRDCGGLFRFCTFRAACPSGSGYISNSRRDAIGSDLPRAARTARANSIITRQTRSSKMPDDSAANGKRLLFVVEETYEDLELWYPKLRLVEA